MPDNSEVKITREQLYNEIWEISVTGVAKKYNSSYGLLLKLCKEAEIPIPPSGYWTKISFGKSAEKISLPESATEFVVLPNIETLKHSKKKSVKKGQPKERADEPSESSKPEQDVHKEEHETASVETYTHYGQTYNVYKRETLYKEVWEKPVTEVAKKYGVSDVAIHKVCKSLDVPTPPNGYWAKVYAGKPVTKTPLPKTDKPAVKHGIRPGRENVSRIEGEPLKFLNDEEQTIILAIANQIQLRDEGARMHPKIIAHRRKISEWYKNRKRDSGAYRSNRYNNNSPFLAEAVSEETLPRIFHIIDSLIHAMEPLGCSLTDDIKFIVMGETVSLQITEAKDQVDHIITKEENMLLLKYEDEKKRYSWASKPNIRKYDHIYNGRIGITVQNLKNFRDCKSYVVEDRLGDILIQMYEASNALRLEREAKEEAERKRKEEERLREEHRQRYNLEVDRTLALTNLAEDYDTASKIRRYVSAVEASGNMDEKTLAWIEWAKAKADWYDPTVAGEDEFFGKRKHEEDAAQKKLEHAGGRWW
ncbi:MAG: hypothetical protein RO469_05435 [Thermincola sp.]|nr:hypothetical protein [Thermincola sp.]MDT3704739.1 hypothetical protein [Thermincola sp.]